MAAPVERDEGYDDWLDAIEAGDAYFVECSNGHGSLPPRRACPRCGDRELTERELPATGTLETHTTVHVATPQLEDDTPYITAIAGFGPVKLTGMVRGVDHGTVEPGITVGATVETTETTGRRVLVFRPA